MRFCVLGSGSKGNSTFVESGGTALLIDAGFSGVETARRLESVGLDIAELSAILVTHEHADHVSGVGVLSRRYGLPVFANLGTREAAGGKLDKLHSFNEFQTGGAFKLANLSIHPFAISHDSVDPVGYVISDGCAFLGYCTDTGMVSRLIHHRLSGCSGLVLECNHDLEMLRNGPYPVSLQQRIRSKSGHLANSEAVEFLKEILHPGLEHVTLAHISESNNSRELVMENVGLLMSEIKAANGTAIDLQITLASQNRPGKLVQLQGNNKEKCNTSV